MPADVWFSKCVRIRVNWICEYAGTDLSNNRAGLDCSHYVGRGKWSVRFDSENAFAHSYGSHSWLGSNPSQFKFWVMGKLGKERYDALLERSQDLSRGREYRKANKLKQGRTTVLAAYYKGEYERMEEMRNDGIVNRVEFVPFI